MKNLKLKLAKEDPTLSWFRGWFGSMISLITMRMLAPVGGRNREAVIVRPLGG